MVAGERWLFTISGHTYTNFGVPKEEGVIISISHFGWWSFGQRSAHPDNRMHAGATYS